MSDWAADLLEQVAGGAGHDGGEQGLVVVVGGEDEAVDLGVVRADVAADVDAAAVGQPRVQDGDVGSGRGDAMDGFARRARLTDDRRCRASRLSRSIRPRRTISWSSRRKTRIG